MKLLKIIGILVLVYVAVVIAFESWLGYAQPTHAGTLIITTTGDDGERHRRVLSAMETDGRLYVSANHWPRAWFRDVLRRPNVEITRNGETRPYVAVPVTGAERARVAAEHPHGLLFRILTGFPPRRFVRLDPHVGSGGADASR